MALVWPSWLTSLNGPPGGEGSSPAAYCRMIAASMLFTRPSLLTSPLRGALVGDGVTVGGRGVGVDVAPGPADFPRTKMSATPLPSFATRFPALDWNATAEPSLPTVGDVLAALPSLPPSTTLTRSMNWPAAW